MAAACHKFITPISPDFSHAGEVFVRMVKMILIPLVVSSVISSVSQVNGKVIGKLGVRVSFWQSS
jgi:Na+/H+-dicarboxylate symporter